MTDLLRREFVCERSVLFQSERLSFSGGVEAMPTIDFELGLDPCSL